MLREKSVIIKINFYALFIIQLLVHVHVIRLKEARVCIGGMCNNITLERSYFSLSTVKSVILVLFVASVIMAESSSLPSDGRGLRELLSRAMQCLDAADPGPSSRLPASRSPSLNAIYSERNSMFNFSGKKRSKGATAGGASKKRKIWEHEFICLASSSSSKVPSPWERSQLISAGKRRCTSLLSLLHCHVGLGKKSISLYLDADSVEFNQRILETFPKLRDAGGYEFLRVGPKVGELEVIPNCYTPGVLKEVVLQAKTYIRPIQKDLSLHPLDDSVRKNTTCTLQ